MNMPQANMIFARFWVRMKGLRFSKGVAMQFSPYFRHLALAGMACALAFGLAVGPVSATATKASQPAQKSQPAADPDSGRPQHFDSDTQTSDKAAEDLIRKLYAAKIKDMKSYIPDEPKIFARFVSLGPGKPKNSIAAVFNQPGVCGVQYCETAIAENLGDNKYRTVWDYNAGDFFLIQGPNPDYYDLVLPTPTNVGNANTIWRMDPRTKEYEFVSGPNAN